MKNENKKECRFKNSCAVPIIMRMREYKGFENEYCNNNGKNANGEECEFIKNRLEQIRLKKSPKKALS